MKRFIITSVLFCILKLAHSQAGFLWANSIGGPSADASNSIAVDVSGNVYTFGHFQGIADLDPGTGTFTMASSGSNDIFIQKTDASGNFIWAKQIGGSANDLSNSITLDPSGNICLIGQFSGQADFDPGPTVFTLTSSGFYDVFILKLDAAGNFIFAKKIGGNALEFATHIQTDGSGNIYYTSQFSNTVDFDPGTGIYNLTSFVGASDIIVSKLDGLGNFVWAKQIGGSGVEYSGAICLDQFGNIHTSFRFEGTIDCDPSIGTFTFSSFGQQDIGIVKLDAGGNFIFAKQIGGAQSDMTFRSMVLDMTGNIYLTGRFLGTCDFDPGTSVYNLNPATTNDCFVLKLDAAGNFIFAKQIGSASGYGIALDGSGNIYIAGDFSNTTDFDPSTGVFNLTAFGSGTIDVFVLKLTAIGNFVWAEQIGGALNDAPIFITLDPLDNIYVCGNYDGTCDFNPSSGIYNLTASGNLDGFTLKLDAGPVGINENEFTKTNFNLYPNPAFDKLKINSSTNIETITITDIFGKTILHFQNINKNEFEINTSSFAQGVYFANIKTQQATGVKNFVKQ